MPRFFNTTGPCDPERHYMLPLDQAMVSFLRQLRGGFAARGVGKFPVSVALVGRHSAETGQTFSDEAVRVIWDYTRGQPWLVNALCKKCVWTVCARGETIGKNHVDEARELIIQDRTVHLDSLAERLRDPRVKNVVQTILTGESDPSMMRGDDFRFTLDMGLVSIANGNAEISNPIYSEVVARVLSEEYQVSIAAPEFRWTMPDGRLDMDALLAGFQRFWRRNGDLWEKKADYSEAFPHLLLMAFLQRVVNGGGRIEREYAAGRGRMDLAVHYAGSWNIIEIKLVHPGDSRDTTVAEGLEQIAGYRDRIDPEAPAWLVVFDRTLKGREKSWDERLSHEIRESRGRQVTVIGG